MTSGFHHDVNNTCALNVLLTGYCADDKIENEMGWACGTYG